MNQDTFWANAGCFDLEEEAARAYDKMMLWCELHNTAGVKGGITNYDASEYEKDLQWLQSITQVRCERCVTDRSPGESPLKRLMAFTHTGLVRSENCGVMT
jgi:hypothetical protein